MNHLVEIKYSKSEKYPKILINGEVISRYMSLSEYIYDDIFCWADVFFDIIDSELAENYDVSLTGHPYHEIILRAAMGNSEYCQTLSFEKNEYRISVEDKYRYVLDLNEKHSLIPRRLAPSIEFTSVKPEAFEELGVPGLVVTTQDSNYSIDFDGADVGTFAGKYCVLVGTIDKVVKRRHSICLYVAKEHLPILIDYFNTYHLRLPVIEETFSKLTSRSFDHATMLEFEAYNQEEYRIIVNDIPKSLESGITFGVKYRYFPKCFEPPKIKISTSDPKVIAYENDTWRAKDPGTCEVRVTDDAGVVYVSQQIEVFRHNYVTNIIIDLPSTTVRVGETLTFNTVITPTDAEDLGEIAYRVSDESVAVMTGPKQLYALTPGRVCVTVSTPRVERRVYITVPSQPTGLLVSGESIDLPHPAEATVYCSVVPSDVPEGTKVVWAVSDKNVIRIKGSNSKKCCVESVGAGSAMLLCKIDGTNIYKKIHVTVKKPKGCYVATAVYGSYDCPEVWVLRRFRDHFLDKHWLGRRFVDVYYAVSPKAVTLFGEYKWFNRFFKDQLDRLVCYLQKKGYEKTPYED